MTDQISVHLTLRFQVSIDENKSFQIKLEHAEKEVQKLREVESSLFKTLKTAEDTGANLVDQANKAAELENASQLKLQENLIQNIQLSPRLVQFETGRACLLQTN